jgi:hypothetical protein
MFGHLYNVSYAARTGSDLEGVMTGLEWYREATDGYFGEPELTETGDGWYVVLVSPRSGRVCSVYRGSVGVWPAIREGLPRCRLPPPWDRLALFVALLLGGTVASVTAWRDASSTDVPLDQA